MKGIVFVSNATGQYGQNYVDVDRRVVSFKHQPIVVPVHWDCPIWCGHGDIPGWGPGAIVIIVICLVISHKVTPLNRSSLAFLWSVVLRITMAPSLLVKRTFFKSDSQYDSIWWKPHYGSLENSRVKWNLLGITSGNFGVTSLNFSPLDFLL